MAGNTGDIIVLDRMTSITGTCKHRIQFGLQHRLDEAAHPITQARFDRVKPIVEKIGGSLSRTMIGIGIHGSLRHGVVSFLSDDSNVG